MSQSQECWQSDNKRSQQMLTLLRSNTWMRVCDILGINKTVSALWLMWSFRQRFSEEPNRAAEAVKTDPLQLSKPDVKQPVSFQLLK